MLQCYITMACSTIMRGNGIVHKSVAPAIHSSFITSLSNKGVLTCWNSCIGLCSSYLRFIRSLSCSVRAVHTRQMQMGRTVGHWSVSFNAACPSRGDMGGVQGFKVSLTVICHFRCNWGLLVTSSKCQEMIMIMLRVITLSGKDRPTADRRTLVIQRRQITN